MQHAREVFGHLRDFSAMDTPLSGEVPGEQGIRDTER